MERKRDFYVTLSSNASTDCYPNNTIGHFWNRLSEPIQFADSREWEVGLTEISMPPNMMSLQPGKSGLSLIVKAKFTLPLPPMGPNAPAGGSVNLERFMYLSSFTYAAELRRQYVSWLQHEDAPEMKKVEFDNPEGKYSLRIRIPKNVKLFLSGRLAHVMGINPKDMNEDGSIGSFDQSSTYYGMIDWHVGHHSLWVYSNCCAHRLVGDASAPLLRTLLMIRKDEGSMFRKLFTDPYYLDVRQNFFSSLEVFITDNQGQGVAFFPGEAVVILHFRRRSPQQRG